MMSISLPRTIHVALYDTLTESEIGHLLVELRTGRFTGTRFDIVTVAESHDPITTMGGLRVVPDTVLDELDRVPVTSSSSPARRCGTPAADSHLPPPPGGSSTPGSRWRPSAAPRPASREPDCLTSATTRAPPPNTWQLPAMRTALATSTRAPSSTATSSPPARS